MRVTPKSGAGTEPRGVPQGRPGRTAAGRSPLSAGCPRGSRQLVRVARRPSPDADPKEKEASSRQPPGPEKHPESAQRRSAARPHSGRGHPQVEREHWRDKPNLPLHRRPEGLRGPQSPVGRSQQRPARSTQKLKATSRLRRHRETRDSTSSSRVPQEIEALRRRARGPDALPEDIQSEPLPLSLEQRPGGELKPSGRPQSS